MEKNKSRESSIKPSNDSDMELQVHESSLSNEQREYSVDHFKEPIERCSSLMSQMRHIIDIGSSPYGEESKHQVWKGAMIEELQLVVENDVWKVVLVEI